MIFKTGVAILVMSLAGYAGAMLVGMARFCLNLSTAPDAMAFGVVGIFASFPIIALGWFVDNARTTKRRG